MGRPATRAIAIQVVGTFLVLGVAVGAGWLAWQRMRAQGFAYGFDILFRQTGWSIVSPFLSQAPVDPYWWTLCVGLVNTAVVGLVSIVLATLVGGAVGLALLSGNKVLASLARIYIEAFRNVPLVLQAVFWYVTFSKLPNPRADPPSLFSAIFLTNKGIFVPRPGGGPDAATLAFLAVLLALVLVAPPVLRRRGVTVSRRWRLAGCAGVGVIAAACIAFAGAPTLSLPRLAGFSFHGGSTLSLEFMALTFAMVIFSSAYIAEIVRGGLLAVPKGHIEAARSLGLSAVVTFLKIRFPIALRAMLPPLGNQYVFVMKATALGLAVGYSDLFSVSVVSISHSGQSIEFLVVMMAAYFLLNYAITLLMQGLERALAFEGARR